MRLRLKYLLSILLFLLSASAGATLQVRWIGVAGLILEDGETTLLFDPVFSRPGILNWLGLQSFRPDSQAISANLEYLGLKKADAVFVSHEHFDHAVDAARIAGDFKAPIYGGVSLSRVVSANLGIQAADRFHAVKDRDEVSVGRFKIQFYRREHSSIFPAIGFHFLPGPVSEPFTFGFYEYREGEVWCYRVMHPEGKIFIDQGSRFFEGAAPDLKGVDFVMAGVANKVSVKDYVDHYAGRLKPRILIPLHFDFFFMKANREETMLLPGAGLDEIRKTISTDFSSIRFILPKFGERVLLK